MFLVLVLHANFFSLGAPNSIECNINPATSAFRIFLKSMSIVAVNVFVLISGWFGINFRIKSLLKFLFQVLFFSFGIYLFSVAFLGTSVSLKGVAACFQISRSLWFVKAYLCLFILSPVLNSFCKSAEKKEFFWVLVSFFIFQTVYGLSGAAYFIQHGYSTISFIGLYLLAQYIHRFIPYRFSFKVYGGGYIGCILLITGIDFLSRMKSFPVIDMYSYINPLVILASVFLLLMFSRINLKSAFINWTASSCFAVYLLHMNDNLRDRFFKVYIKQIYELYDGLICLIYIGIALIAIFFFAILIDQVRKYVWFKINAHIPT